MRYLDVIQEQEAVVHSTEHNQLAEVSVKEDVTDL